MNHTAPIHELEIRPIALDRLVTAPENVRRTAPDAAAEAELKASIAAHGLLENLVVRSDGPGGGYAVIAGGRRLAALKALAEDGALDAAHPVPCLVVDGDAPSAELSLAENVVRIAMHPADQVAAFRDLAESGSSVSSIAARFGISERLVEQRLRLGNAAPELLDAYRDGTIDLETLKGFAVTTDHRRQMTVYEQVASQGYRPTAWQVKRLLTEDRVPANSAVAHFVGVDAYEAAGGAVLRDLFSDEDESGVWLEDPVLLNNLAMEKLDHTAKDLATRWRWATAAPEVDWTELARYGRIQPEPATPTDEEAAELERLRSREDELCELDEDEWTEQLGEEACAIETRTDEIHAMIEARAAYQAEDYAIAGCIATIAGTASSRSSRDWSVPGTCPSRPMPARATAVTPVTVTTATPRVPTGSGDRPSPVPWPRPRIPRPRRARRRGWGSGSRTISDRSARLWSRRIWARTSRRPSTSCCSSSAGPCSRMAPRPMPWTSSSGRHPTVRPCA